jgi:leucyl-tRNA synthetase
MWKKLRNRCFLGFKFLRQHPIITDVTNGKTGFYIADFYCAEKNLVIEIDGLIHSLQADYDKARDDVMKDFGLIVLRITNAEVKKNIEAVLSNIKNCLQ